MTQLKQEKDALASKFETLKKENESLRDLIKYKDGQIEDSRRYDAEWRTERDRMQEELRTKTDMLQKRETEIKEVVKTL